MSLSASSPHFYLFLLIGLGLVIGMAAVHAARAATRIDSFASPSASSSSSQQLVFLGDSILNNANYVPKGQSTYDLTKQQVPNTFQYAQDNAQIQSVTQQLSAANQANANAKAKWNTSNTTIVLSVGGNHLLSRKPFQLSRAQIQDWFTQWLALVQTLKTQFPSARLVVLNLYQPASSLYTPYKPYIDQWNALLQENAGQVGRSYTVIDIHKLLTTAADFISEVEPSAQGSAKIANAVVLQAQSA